MRSTRWPKALALTLGLSLIAAACGDDEDPETTATTAEAGGGETTEGTTAETTDTTEGDGGEAAGDFTACEVTDTGGVDDRSFNQTAFEGLERAAEEGGFEPTVLESSSESDFAPNIEALLEQNCSLIVTVGFLLGDATAEAAEANPDTNFAIVDFDFADPETFEDITYDNVAELTFATDQAAFLAGYLAAAMTETGVVGTYGGLNIPTVTIFMDGFAAGITFFNEETDGAVELVGWDPEAQDGLFTESFDDQTLGRQTTETLLDQNADIILPVAGPVGLGSVEAINAGGGTQKLIWVDTDGCVSVPDACSLFLTSVEKHMDQAVFDTTVAAANDEFESGLYVGTLENDGVGIAPFNEFEDVVPQEIKDRIEELTAEIIAGEIETR
ncbi:MAG: BMP family ABC transporter substrate-binding protein [Actinomycetota bacterium]|nr:BMP family ABC transporter substrate-binding protein [Acidimicrobiia bacterium]MDQ3292929.1 BMP family ABC transporter substrate-binding protein [Actinomycetota bacterium]